MRPAAYPALIHSSTSTGSRDPNRLRNEDPTKIGEPKANQKRTKSEPKASQKWSRTEPEIDVSAARPPQCCLISVVVVFKLMPNGQDENGTDRNIVQGHVPGGARGDDQLSARETHTGLPKEVGSPG